MSSNILEMIRSKNSEVFKRAQLQIGENVIVLVIFFFLLVIAIMFYANIQKSSFAAKSIEFEKMHIIDLKNVISALPQLHCSQNDVVSDACLDMINVYLLQEYWQSVKNDPESDERAYFINKFGKSEITISLVDPMTGAVNPNWEIFSNPDINSNTTYSVFIPIILYNSSSLDPNDYSFGFISLKVYT